MKKNMGTIDKVIRILVALVVVVLIFTNVISGTLALYSVSSVSCFCADKFSWLLSAISSVWFKYEKKRIGGCIKSRNPFTAEVRKGNH